MSPSASLGRYAASAVLLLALVAAVVYLTQVLNTSEMLDVPILEESHVSSVATNTSQNGRTSYQMQVIPKAPLPPSLEEGYRIMQPNADVLGDHYLSKAGWYPNQCFPLQPRDGDHGTVEVACLPNFIFLGGTGTAMTYLKTLIAAHPSVTSKLDPEAEPSFFSGNTYASGIWNYTDQFPLEFGHSGAKLLYEGSCSYFTAAHVHQRMYSLMKNVKLIILFRSPVERAASQYYRSTTTPSQEGFRNALRDDWYQLTACFPSLQLPSPPFSVIPSSSGCSDYPGASTNQFTVKTGAMNEGIISGGFYVNHLRRWLSLYEGEQFFLLREEDITNQSDLLHLTNQLCSYLNIPSLSLDYWNDLAQGRFGWLYAYSEEERAFVSQVDKDTKEWLSSVFSTFNHELEIYLEQSFSW